MRRFWYNEKNIKRNIMDDTTEHSQIQFIVRFRYFKMVRLLAQASFRSRAIGIAPSAMIQFLVGLICTERSLWRWFEEQSAQARE